MWQNSEKFNISTDIFSFPNADVWRKIITPILNSGLYTLTHYYSYYEIIIFSHNSQ